MTKIIIRKFLETDIKECIKIIEKTLGKINAKKAKIDFLEGFYPKTKEYKYLDRFVACDNNRVIAIGGIYRLITHPKNFIGICWFAVQPKYQKHGIGSKMIELSEKKARKFKAKYFFVWTIRKDIHFYKKLGFKKSKKKLKPKESNILLIKKLC
jgi:N-acetylglutamate synthase-like GNAT family acetyltransferase